jgi:hypothetical protein
MSAMTIAFFWYISGWISVAFFAIEDKRITTCSMLAAFLMGPLTTSCLWFALCIQALSNKKIICHTLWSKP